MPYRNFRSGGYRKRSYGTSSRKSYSSRGGGRRLRSFGRRYKSYKGKGSATLRVKSINYIPDAMFTKVRYRLTALQLTSGASTIAQERFLINAPQLIQYNAGSPKGFAYGHSNTYALLYQQGIVFGMTWKVEAENINSINGLWGVSMDTVTNLWVASTDYTSNDTESLAAKPFTQTRLLYSNNSITSHAMNKMKGYIYIPKVLGYSKAQYLNNLTENAFSTASSTGGSVAPATSASMHLWLCDSNAMTAAASANFYITLTYYVKYFTRSRQKAE